MVLLRAAFRNVDLKLKWADGNILRVDEEFRNFVRSNPVRIVHERDKRTRNMIVKLALTDEIPFEITKHVGYALYDLRSSLEYMAVAAAKAYGTIDTANVRFPFCRTESDLNEKLFRGTKRSQPLAKLFGGAFAEIVKRAKPYSGGDDFLYAFNQIANHERHIDLVPISTVSPGPDILSGLNIIGQASPLIVGAGGNLTEGIKLLELLPEGSIEAIGGVAPNISLPIQLTFVSAGILSNEEVIQVLKHIRYKISTILNDVTDALVFSTKGEIRHSNV